MRRLNDWDCDQQTKAIARCLLERPVFANATGTTDALAMAMTYDQRTVTVLLLGPDCG